MWEDIFGLDSAVDKLKELIVAPAKFPDMFKGARKALRTLLLYGPAGSGKSYLAKACATALNYSFYVVDSGSFCSMWSDGHKRVPLLFELARTNKPSLILIEELDSLFGSDQDSKSDHEIKMAFLKEMLAGEDVNENVIIIANSNTPWQVDKFALKHFEKSLYIGLPDLSARARMLKAKVAEHPCALQQEDFTSLAEATDRYSGSEIVMVVMTAVREAQKRCPEKESGAFTALLTIEDFELALKHIKASYDEDDMAAMEEFHRDYS